MAKGAYQAYLKAKQEEEKRKAEGRINFKQDSRGSRNRPALSGYSGESEDKNYKWETDLLKPLSIKKYGRSYKDKFSNWAKSQGLNEDEYRRHMDFEEDRNKEGHYAYGTKTVGETIDSIFGNMSKKQTEARKRAPILQAEKEKRDKEKAKKKEEPKENKILDGVMKTLEIIDRPGDAVRTGIKEKMEGNSFWEGAKDGFTGKKDTTGKELNKVFGFDPSSDQKDSKISDYLGELTIGSTGMLGRGLSYLLPKEQREEKVNQLGTEVAGMGTELVLDPLNLVGAGIGKGVTKGLQTASNRSMQSLLPTNEAVSQSFTNAFKGYDGVVSKPNMKVTGGLIPTPKPQVTIPRGTPLDEALANPRPDIPEPNAIPQTNNDAEGIKKAFEGLGAGAKEAGYRKVLEDVAKNGYAEFKNPHAIEMFRKDSRYAGWQEVQENGTSKFYPPESLINPGKKSIPKPKEADPELKEAIQQQYEYLKNSMGKGVDYGTTGYGVGNRREVNGSFSVSRNPKWYQDFYAQHGRKPNNAELRELAEQHVREGFADEVGNIPAWSPQKVREIDQEIADLEDMIRQSPDQEELLNPILAGLKEDRAAALKESGMDPNKQYQYMRANKSKPLPDNVQAMQNEIVPLRQPSGKKVKPITRQELMSNMRKNLGVTLRHGRLGNVDDNVSGYFKVDPEVIRTKNYGDIGVISHEIGHHLDKQFKLTDPTFDNELLKLGKNTSGKGYTKEQIRDEGLAEFIRLYLSDPQKALSEAPNFSQHFENVLPKKVKNGLIKTQNDVDRWIEQGEYNRAAGKIDHTGGKTSIRETLDKTYSELIDKYDYARKVEIAATGKVNKAENSLYKRLRLSAGAPKIAERYLTDLKRIIKPIDTYGYNKKEVSRYIAMVHARNLEAQGIESGFLKGEIDSVISKLDSPEMQKIQKQLVMYSNNLLDILVKSGRISQKAVDAMRKKHPDYVPFFRHFDEDMAGGFGGKGFANLTNPVKRLKGSTKDVIDPLESLVKNTFAIINTAEKNKVGLELLKLSKFEGAGKFVEVVPGNKSMKENVVTVYKDGEPMQLQLDKDLHRVVQQMDEETSNLVVKMLSVPAQTLRAGATLTPEFMLRNPIRDQFQAFVVTENGYFPPRDLPIGLFHAIMGKKGKSALYEQWARSGGGYGNTLSVDRNYLREQLNQLKKEGNKFNRGFKTITNPKEWLKVLQSLSELTEEATKLGEFNRGIKKGKSFEEAAFQSRDLMDFARSGNAVKEANKVVAFLNANIQGKDKLIRSFKANPGRSTIKAITGVTLPTIGAYLSMQYLANDKQKETWQNAPKWMRDSFMFFPIPGTDVVARIPKAFDLSTIFGNPAEQLLDHIYKNDPASLEEFAKGTAVSLLKVPYMLTGVAPMIENWANKSFFTGAPVVPMRDKDVLPEEQYGPSTSLTARTIGKLTADDGLLGFLPGEGASPYKVDNFIRGYGAGLGKYATSGMDNLLEALSVGKMPPQEKKKWSELPLLNAFTVDSTGGGKVVDDYYNTLETLTKGYKTAQKREEDYDRTEDYKYLQYKIGKEMSGLNKQYREVLESYDLSPEEKRRQLDEIDSARKELARRALEEIGE